MWSFHLSSRQTINHRYVQVLKRNLNIRLMDSFQHHRKTLSLPVWLPLSGFLNFVSLPPAEYWVWSAQDAAGSGLLGRGRPHELLHRNSTDVSFNLVYFSRHSTAKFMKVKNSASQWRGEKHCISAAPASLFLLCITFMYLRVMRLNVVFKIKTKLKCFFIF